MTSSGSSRAKPSIIRTASLLPETIRSRSLCSSSSWVGKGTKLPSTRPSRTEAIGPWNGSERQAQSGRGPVHGQHVGIVLPIAGHDKGLDLDFVAEAVRKQRPDRPIHQARGQCFFDRGPAFALQKAAGKFARRRGPLAIVAGQRKKVGHAGRGGPVAAAVRTTVSPNCTRQLPAACLARKPVSILSVPDPICFSTRIFNVSFLPALVPQSIAAAPNKGIRGQRCRRVKRKELSGQPSPGLQKAL